MIKDSLLTPNEERVGGGREKASNKPEPAVPEKKKEINSSARARSWQRLGVEKLEKRGEGGRAEKEKYLLED